MKTRRVQTLAGLRLKYVTDDGQEFMDLEEAVEHENNLNKPRVPIIVKYEQVWTIQEAINKAVAENRVVRFLSDKSNAEIKKGIDDIKGCKLMKPDRESKDIAVIPPGIEDFDFNEVDMTANVRTKE